MNISFRANLKYIIPGIFIFIYVLLRAIYIPAYNDELSTFFMYVQPGRFQPFYSHLDANNHVLNSLFCHLFFLAFGDSIFVMRLPNVLSLIIYMYYLWKIQKKFSNEIVGFLWFITMISSIYLLTIFSLARGYGMSIAFLMGVCYYSLAYYESGKQKFLWIGLIMSSLALWSSLSLMIPLIILGSILFISLVKNFYVHRIYKQITVEIIIFILLYVLPLLYAIKYSIVLKNSGGLYHGSTGGFINGVILNLTSEFSEYYKHALKILILLVTVYFFASIYAILVKRISVALIIFQFLLWGTIIGTILLHLKMNVNYPQDRVAIYFFVLFITALFFSLDNLNFKSGLVFPILFTTVFVFQLFKSMNLSYAPFWRCETVPVSFYNYLLKWQQRTGITPTISAHGLVGRAFGYYDFQNGGVLNSTQEIDFPSKVADFLIVNEWNEKSVAGYDTVQFNPRTSVALLKRTKLITWEQELSQTAPRSNCNDEYVAILDVPADNFREAPFCYDITFNIQSKHFPLHCFITTELSDSLGNNISYNMLDLERIKSDARHAASIHSKYYLETIPKESKIIKIYFWNQYKEKMELSDLKIALFKGIAN